MLSEEIVNMFTFFVEKDPSILIDLGYFNKNKVNYLKKLSKKESTDAIKRILGDKVDLPDILRLMDALTKRQLGEEIIVKVNELFLNNEKLQIDGIEDFNDAKQGQRIEGLNIFLQEDERLKIYKELASVSTKSTEDAYFFYKLALENTSNEKEKNEILSSICSLYSNNISSEIFIQNFIELLRSIEKFVSHSENILLNQIKYFSLKLLPILLESGNIKTFKHIEEKTSFLLSNSPIDYAKHIYELSFRINQKNSTIAKNILLDKIKKFKSTFPTEIRLHKFIVLFTHEKFEEHDIYDKQLEKLADEIEEDEDFIDNVLSSDFLDNVNPVDFMFSLFSILSKGDSIQKDKIPKISEFKSLLNENLDKTGLYKYSNFNFLYSQYNKLLYKANISLTHVHIKEFKGFENLTINFSPKINIILGKNGFGKTSILQALALTILPENDRDTIRLQSDGFEGLTKQGAEKIELEVNWENDFLKRKVIIEDKEKSIVEEGEFVEFVPKMVFLAYGTNTFISESKNKFSTRVQEVIAEVPKWYHTQSLFSDFSDEFVDPIDFFNEMERYEFHDVDEKKAEIKIAKDYLIRILNELIPKYKIQKDKTNYFFVDEQGNRLKTQQLSEGYRANVILLTDMLTRLLSLREEMNSSLGEEEKIPIDKAFEQMKGIIAIDEFDRHLHPTWQRDFVNKLAQYFPKIQFVLTTHNPMAILDREECEVHQVIENENGNYEIVQHKGGTKNMDVVVTLLKYFETDSVVSTNLQEKLDRYYLLLETEPENPAVEELLQEIKDAYLGITIPDYKYLTYLKFLRKKGIDLNDRKQLDSLDFDNPEWDELSDEISKILN